MAKETATEAFIIILKQALIFKSLCLHLSQTRLSATQMLSKKKKKTNRVKSERDIVPMSCQNTKHTMNTKCRMNDGYSALRMSCLTTFCC